MSLTILTAAIVLHPYLDSFYAWISLLGVAIGSLIPDSDSPDALIYHNRVKALGGEGDDLINQYFAPFFPLFGYSTKYLIYKPSAYFYRSIGVGIEEKHRGLMHSILGIITSTFLTAVYILPVLWILNFLNYEILAVFMLSYLFGAFMHLLEDSITVSGVKWLYPASGAVLKGDLKTTTENTRMPDTLSYVLLAVFGTFYGFSNSLTTSLVAILVVSVLWLFFLFYNGISLER